MESLRWIYGAAIERKVHSVLLHPVLSICIKITRIGVCIQDTTEVKVVVWAEIVDFFSTLDACNNTLSWPLLREVT